MAAEQAPARVPLLSVRDLHVRFPTERGTVNAVNGVSFDLYEGHTLAIVGESGSGKSVTAKTLMNLLPRSAQVSGEVTYDGQDVRALAAAGTKHFFGVQMTMVFQDPMTSLNPVKKVGEQIAETLRYHLGRSRREALREAEDLFDQVGIPEPARRVSQYPHELSGGLRQRVVIAMALACQPRLLIADEPTTAVDVTVQKHLLDLLDRLRRDRGMSMILITHDLGVAHGRADDVAVMYAGRIVETADARTLFYDMRHPYTEALLRSIPRIDDPVHHRLDPIPGPPTRTRQSTRRVRLRSPLHLRPGRLPRRRAGAERAGRLAPLRLPPSDRHRAGQGRSGRQQGRRHHCGRPVHGRGPGREQLMAGTGHAQLRDRDDVLLSVKDLVVQFPAGRKRVVHAVSQVSFDVAKGETLGIVGESGCGKSTVARAIVRLVDITAGEVLYEDQDLAKLSGEDLRKVRPNLQMIFQDPISSLNPRRRVRDVIGEGLAVWGDEIGSWSLDRVDELMDAVGVEARFGDRRPHEFSGGQCQRIGIARALALDPKVLICDEPVSALDVSIQAQILNLLQDMKRRYGLTVLFISHDLAVVKNISDRIVVMYLGKVCEIGSTQEIYSRPAHPYTRALLASIPEPAPTVDVSEGDIGDELPSATAPPSGCRFHTRCPRATELCRDVEPTSEQIGDVDHYVACHHPVAVEISAGSRG